MQRWLQFFFFHLDATMNISCAHVYYWYIVTPYHFSDFHIKLFALCLPIAIAPIFFSLSSSLSFSFYRRLYPSRVFPIFSISQSFLIVIKSKNTRN